MGLGFRAMVALVHVGVLSFPAVAPTEDIPAEFISFISFKGVFDMIRFVS